MILTLSSTHTPEAITPPVTLHELGVLRVQESRRQLMILLELGPDQDVHRVPLDVLPVLSTLNLLPSRLGAGGTSTVENRYPFPHVHSLQSLIDVFHRVSD